jgi:hypothetical protein
MSSSIISYGRLVSLLFALLITSAAGAAPGAAAGAVAGAVAKTAASEAGLSRWSFDDLAPGKLPAGWQVEATNPRGAFGDWRVATDAAAPSGDRVLAMQIPERAFGGTFNLCWTPQVRFLDGEIEVRFKAISGREDQGGGVIWRARDRNNYYIARFNPLEDNFRIYYVRDGARRTLESTRVSLPAGVWHTLKIVQRGNHFEGYLNGKKLLEGENDLFTTAGGVGLWTKADASTRFDDFRVELAPSAGR